MNSSEPYVTIDDRPPRMSIFRACFYGLTFVALIGMVCTTLYLAVDVRKIVQDNNKSLGTIVSGMGGSGGLGSIPRAFGVDNMPPRKFQKSRGTCWDFGMVGAFEHQYHLAAIQAGLPPVQYYQFSEQALGAEIITLCQQQQQKCLLPGDNVAFNSTEGGEAILLYTFQNELRRGLVPAEVCPYIATKGNDTVCPGLEDAVAQNPVSWTLDSFTTLFDIDHIKQQLVSSAHAMPFTIAVHQVSYYASCNDPNFSAHPQCFSKYPPCTPCPLSFNSQCCAKIIAPMYNMNGEFRKHHELELEAGHVMVLAGYNDEYMTEDGMRGGFIMRNSWMDGVYGMMDEFHAIRSRGSHSMQFFLQQVSPANERAPTLCPNSENPRNWYTCTGQEDCLNPNTAKTALANFQPLELYCRPNAACDRRMKYYLINSTRYGDDFNIFCAFEYDNTTRTGAPYCWIPMLIDSFAGILGPVVSYPNNDQFCGYYFFPYDLIRESNSRFQSFFVNDYHFKFSTNSFVNNMDSSFNYSLLGMSKKVYTTGFPSFPTPYPNV